MKSDFAKIVYCAAILAAGCAAEELLPKFLGAGFPVLLAATVFLSARSGIFAAVAFAIAAGAAPPNEKVAFVLDRPFLFAVTARDGSILFAGTVTDIGE